MLARARRHFGKSIPSSQSSSRQLRYALVGGYRDFPERQQHAVLFNNCRSLQNLTVSLRVTQDLITEDQIKEDDTWPRPL
jgi:hypothetical protein